jgi:hypothetical protein
MYGFIFGFHLLAPWPKWAPALINFFASSFATNILQRTNLSVQYTQYINAKLLKITQNYDLVKGFCKKSLFCEFMAEKKKQQPPDGEMG